MIDGLETDASLEPSQLRELSDDQKCRLTDLLDRYLQSLENGDKFDTSRVVAEHPDLCDAFQVYLAKLDALHGIAVGLGEGRQAAAFSNGQAKSMQLGDFTIHREIGRGGMGVVYEATQDSLKRKVAIKLLPMASLLDGQQIARFRNEAHAAGLLQHPHIVPVYHVGVENGIHYYAMQLIDGISMDQWIREQASGELASSKLGRGDTTASRIDSQATWQIVVGWAIDVATALHCAHEAGVVHRDVKPSNLMLDVHGKIWITDFGLARCQSDASLTNSGDLVGTMRYMSPEQTRGESALVDGRTDVYSLATTLYEMLAHQPAFEGEDAPTILKRIDEQLVTPIRQLRPELPRDLETVIEKAMSRNRDGRYESPAQFAADLGRLLRGEPTHARPASLSDLVARWAAKHRRSVLAAVLVGTIGLVGLTVATLLIIGAKQESDTNAAWAERNELLARSAVNRLGSQMAELLAEIPAADAVRRRLLSETLDYYIQFAANASDEPERRRELAMTLGKIGSLQSELGASSEAISSLRKSEALYNQLASQDATNVAICLEWSTSQNNLAQALQRSGQLEQAALVFTKSINSFERLIADLSAQPAENGSADNPSSPQRELVDVKLGLSTTLNNLGLLLAETGAAAEAEASYQRAIELLDSASIQHASQSHQLQLALLKTNLSRLLSKTAPRLAVDSAKQALALQTAALNNDRGNAGLTTQVIITLNALGTAQLENNQSTAAVTTLNQAIEISEQLLQRWPDQPTYQRDMVISQNHLGLALSRSSQLKQARDNFEQALGRARHLAADFPADAEIQSMLASVLNNLGFLQQQFENNAAASDCFSEAVVLQSKAVELAPEVGRYQQLLKKHQYNLQQTKEVP